MRMLISLIANTKRFVKDIVPVHVSGLLFDSGTSLYVTVAYVAFIVFLFVILKFTVLYLHSLFDTVDPTFYPPTRSLKVAISFPLI